MNFPVAAFDAGGASGRKGRERVAGENDGEATATGVECGCLDGAAEDGDHALHNIEPEAGALDRANVGATLEGLEDAGAIRLRYADALIRDGHLRLCRADGEPDRDERAGGGVAHRIAEEVGKDVLEQIKKALA